jgi:uncharacterized damage-inducible protein DinB
MSAQRAIVASIEGQLRRYKTLAEDAIAQVEEERLAESEGVGNSIAIIVWHVSGNLASRFTDFLSSDGEKPWRDRDSEFVERRVTREQLLQKWNNGWSVLFATLADLDDAALQREVSIRREPLTVAEALHRALAHVSYHVGQIVHIAKSARGGDWRWLSIPPGKSSEANANPSPSRARTAGR